MEDYREAELSKTLEQLEDEIADGLAEVGATTANFMRKDIQEPVNQTLRQLSGGYLPEIHIFDSAPDPGDFRRYYQPGQLVNPIINSSRFRQPQSFDFDKFRSESPLIPLGLRGFQPYRHDPYAQPSGQFECHQSNWTPFFRPVLPDYPGSITRYEQPIVSPDILCLFRPSY